MPKKKRKRNRRPIVPPVHSAPHETPRIPSRPPEPLRAPSEAGDLGTGLDEPIYEPDVVDRPRPRPQARRRKKSSRRPWVITGLIVVAFIGAFVARQMLANREINALNGTLASSSCEDVRETDDGGTGEHLDPGQLTETEYSTDPPAGGPHDGDSTVPAGVYKDPLGNNAEERLSIYAAIHSLEHGAVVIWHDGLKKDERIDLENAYRNEAKVIVAPYTQMPKGKKVALTAWNRISYCSKAPDKGATDGFIDLFRDARTAPEPRNPI